MEKKTSAKNTLSADLNRLLIDAAVNDWGSLVADELNVQDGVLSFQAVGQEQWLPGKTALLVKRGSKRLICPVQFHQSSGLLSADLSAAEELICSEKDKPAKVFLAALAADGTLSGWQLFGGSLQGQPAQYTAPASSSMLVQQRCRHLTPVARRTVNGVQLCAQPYLQRGTGKLMIQITSLYRAERMASERWTQSREEYQGANQQLSVVLSADADADLLRASVSSLLNQGWSFRQNMQLILCDFGADAEVSALCADYQAQYPENIFVEDVSGCTDAEAKNQGLARAEGKYLIFMRAHHRLAPKTCPAVYAFSEQNYQSADVFVVPILASEDQLNSPTADAQLSPSRTVDLEEFPGYRQYTLASSFLKREAAQKYSFEAEEDAGGDLLFLLKLMTDKCCIGLSNVGGSFCCRSIAGIAPVGWYDRYFAHFPHDILQYCEAEKHWTPDFIQRYLVVELAKQMRRKNIGMDQEKDRIACADRLQAAFRQLDDSAILSAKRNLSTFELAQIFMAKYGEDALWIDYRWHNASLRAHGSTIGSLAMSPVTVDFIELEHGSFSIEGFVPLPIIAAPEQVTVWLRAGSQWHPCDRPRREVENCNAMGLLFHYVPFYVKIPITHELMEQELSLYYAIDSHLIRCRYLSLKKYCPLSSTFACQYYYKDGVVLTKNNSVLMLHPCKGLAERMRYEQRYIEDVRNTIQQMSPSNPLAQVDVDQVARLRRKAILHKMNPWRGQVWLISDRINRGDDNGEVFFRYMQTQQKKRGRKVYFVIGNDCEDYNRIRKIGPVISTLSEEHKLKHMTADWILSSQANDPVLRPFGAETVLYQDLCSDFKFVFLQHGVTKDNQSAWLNRYNRKMEGFVVSTRPEYDSIFEYNYYHSRENVWLTGFPRSDALYDEEKNYITIMPTWRKSLTKGMDPVTSVWLVVDDFKSSSFFQFYNSLLNNKRLLDKAEELGYQICFKPHPNFLSVLDQFQKDPRVIFFEQSKSYREIYAQSKLLLTDYSSAVFDFALMNKPVIYSQFDADEFFNGSHSYVEGYFDYQRDGFGEVEHDLEGTVDRIIEYMENGCRVKPLYQERIQNTFVFHDRENCKRVYEKMMEHSGEKSSDAPTSAD